MVEWVERDKLRGNSYNPNHVAVTELDLLDQSIFASGWTQPIVARTDMEIVDGFHRWTVSQRPRIWSMTNGLVPVVYLTCDLASQMFATIRHNRARGQHTVAQMARIVQALIDQHGKTIPDLILELGMEDEEVERLFNRAGMPEKMAKEKGTFNQAWEPTRNAAESDKANRPKKPGK